MELKKYRLGEICEVVNGATPSTKDSDNYDGSIIWITPKDLSDQKKKYIKRGQRMITEKGFNCCSAQMIPPYNILMSSRAPIGLLAINQSECCTNQGFKNLVLDKTLCDVDFMYYYLKFHIKEIEALGTGTTFMEVSKSSLLNFEVKIPNINMQRDIAKCLSDIDRKIALNKRINDNLEAMANQLYDYWFVQFDFPNGEGKPYKASGGAMVWNEKLKREIPEGWDVSNVNSLIEPIERGVSYSSDEILDMSATPMINLACFSKAGDYRLGEMKFFSGNIPEAKLISPMDMLIACTDMTQGADIIGRPILASNEFEKYTFSTDLALVIPKGKFKMYLYYTLRTPFYHKYIRPFASGTTVKHLNLIGVENYVLPIPPMGIQSMFENTVAPIKEQQSKNLNEIVTLTKQRDELLPLLMNGQASVNAD